APGRRPRWNISGTGSGRYEVVHSIAEIDVATSRSPDVPRLDRGTSAGAAVILVTRLSCPGHERDHLIYSERSIVARSIELDLPVIFEPETGDGHRIALSGDGQAAPRPGEPVLDIFGNIRLSAAFKDYAWVNERQIWGGDREPRDRENPRRSFMQ